MSESSTIVGTFKAADKWLKLESLQIAIAQFFIIGRVSFILILSRGTHLSLNSEFKEKCIPLDKVKINQTLPIIKNCSIAICNDSSFSHLSAALNIPTIVLLSDTPLMYGSYSPNMYPIIPDGEETVTHDTLGKERINPEKIFKIFKEILN